MKFTLGGYRSNPRVLSLGEPAQHKLLVALVAMASSTIMVKVADVQLLEIFFIAYIPIALFYLARDRFIVRLDKVSRSLALHYFILFLVILSLALVDLRLRFYLPLDISLLKQPILITIARLTELLLAFAALLYFSRIFKKDPALLKFGMRWFYFAGIASVVFSFLSLPMHLAFNLDLGTYGDVHRFRGFFNEGGPYGIYLIGIGLVGIFLRSRRWISSGFWFFSIALATSAFLLSQSKAAILAVVVVVAINILATSRFMTRIGLLVGLGAFSIAFIFAFDLPSKVMIYFDSAEKFELLAAQNPEDANLVVGRVAGLVIVPRMIAAHPLSGIGFGNYALMRNDPQYRGGSPYVKWFDSPGLGLIGYAPELGLPVLMYFTYLLAKPYLYVRSKKSGFVVQNMAIFPLIAVLFGAALNFYYPWIIAAFAIAAADFTARRSPHFAS